MTDGTKKVRLSYLIPAQNAIRDQGTGNWSVIGVINFIHIPKDFPAYIAPFVAYGRLENVPAGAIKAEVRLIHEDGTVVDVSRLAGELKAGFVDFAADFPYAKFEKPGVYHFEVEFNSKKVPGGDKFYFQVVKET